MVDKNLFLHDLAIVAILKNEGHYLKEWLNYHLLAGVKHFYLYDNNSPDNQAEVAAPYVKAGLVDYFHVSGKVMQMPVYNEAVRRFKFHCRYMAFLDCDEFIFPKSNQSIVEVLDEIFSRDPNVAGLGINWQIFGSNGQNKADYSRGVLERFTRRAPIDWVIPLKENNLPGGNAHVKTIVNPRRVKFVGSPHCPIFFDKFHPVNENNVVFYRHFNNPVTAEKIVVNHYYTKAHEEFCLKQKRGRADFVGKYSNDCFDMYNRNEVFDDGILKYCAARADKFSLEHDKQKFQRVTDALIKTFETQKFSLETALTCRALSNYLGEKLLEEASLGAILKSIDNLKLSDVQLLLSELPNLLALPYPVVKELREVAIQIISQIMDFMREKGDWKNFSDLDYIRRLLQTWK